MAKGDVILVPVMFSSTNFEELAKLVAAERIKRNQISAPAQYQALSIERRIDSVSSRYTKFYAFIEFMVEEK